jgi:hypothetical protein
MRFGGRMGTLLFQAITVIVLVGWSCGPVTAQQASPSAIPQQKETAQTPEAIAGIDSKTGTYSWANVRRQRDTLIALISEHERRLGQLKDVEQDLRQAESDVRRRERAIREARERKAPPTELRGLADDLEDVKDRTAMMKTVHDQRQRLVMEQDQRKQQLAAVESQIEVMLAPEILYQTFKTYVSIIFALLVLAVIVGFFSVAWRDETVRHSLFASAAAIQFVTLFSLVIAITLFGVVGILEGRELSALLGGLSGYILGRGVHTAGQSAPVTEDPSVGRERVSSRS